jgi:hypothetical protein
MLAAIAFNLADAAARPHGSSLGTPANGSLTLQRKSCASSELRYAPQVYTIGTVYQTGPTRLFGRVTPAGQP